MFSPEVDAAIGVGVGIIIVIFCLGWYAGMFPWQKCNRDKRKHEAYMETQSHGDAQ